MWRFLVAAVGRTDADDCFQETFMAAMRAYPTQITVDGPFFALSNNLGQPVLGTEYYRLVKGERAGAGWALASVTYVSRGGTSRFLLFLLFVDDGDSWKLLYDQNTPLP